MTTQDFIKYYKNGHGKAICALQNIADKEPYRKAFIECLKEQTTFYGKDEYILNLAKILLNEETKKEFIDILFNVCRTVNGFPINIINILFEFVPREEVVSFVEEEYKKAFDLCFVQSENTEEQRAKNIRCHALTIAVNILSGDNDDRLKSLIKDSAKLYETKKDLRPNSILHLKLKHINNEERFNRLFDEALKDSPFYEELRCVMSTDFHAPPRKEYITSENFIEGANDDYHNAYESFCQADAETVKKVAEIGIDENSEHRIIALSLFSDYGYSYNCEDCKPPNFPLDSQYLINIVEKYKKLYTPEPDTPIDGCWAYVALETLASTKNKTAKEYCLSIITDKSVHERLRYEAFGTFRSNYDVSDAELLKEHYFNGYENEVLMLLLSLAKQGIKDTPYEVCFDAYENQVNYNRSHAVFILSSLGLLTDEMIRECRYDECQNIRDLANGLPSEDNCIVRLSV